MLKALSLIVLIAVISGSSAQYQYSPYTRQLSNRIRSLQMEQTTVSPMFNKQVSTGIEKMLPKTRPIVPPTPVKEEFCRGRQPEEKIPFPGDATKFIVCHLGETFDIMSCPRRLMFNIHTNNCENSMRKPRDACAINQCMNGGRCVNTEFNQFKCECPEGFAGRTCEESVTCSPSTCGAGGMCLQMPRGSPVSHFCMCDNGLTYGMACDHRVEPNPCVDNEADLHSFPSSTNRGLYVQCEGHIPHIRFCAYPLIYSHKLQRCDWE